MSSVSKSIVKLFPKTLSALALIAFISNTALADATTATVASGTSESSSKSTLSQIKEKVAVEYDNYMYSAAMEQGEGEFINHYVTTKYKLPNSQFVGFIFRADTFFDNPNKEMNGNKLADSYLRYRYANIVKSDVFNLYGDARYYFPMSDASQKNELSGIINTRIYATSKLGRFELMNVVKPYFYLNNQKKTGQTQFLITNYFETKFRVAKSFALFAGVEPAFTYGRNVETKFNNAPTDLGFEIAIGDHFTVTPYVEFNAVDTEGKSTYGVLSLSAVLL